MIRAFSFPASPERSRLRAWLEGTLAGLCELHLLRERQERRVRQALRIAAEPSVPKPGSSEPGGGGEPSPEEQLVSRGGGAGGGGPRRGGGAPDWDPRRGREVGAAGEGRGGVAAARPPPFLPGGGVFDKLRVGERGGVLGLSRGEGASEEPGLLVGGWVGGWAAPCPTSAAA